MFQCSEQAAWNAATSKARLEEQPSSALFGFRRRSLSFFLQTSCFQLDIIINTGRVSHLSQTQDVPGEKHCRCCLSGAFSDHDGQARYQRPCKSWVSTLLILLVTQINSLLPFTVEKRLLFYDFIALPLEILGKETHTHTSQHSTPRTHSAVMNFHLITAPSI